MKCDIFSPKTLAVISFLRYNLPLDTYWSPDMMKLLVFLADQRAFEAGAKTTISGLIWSVSDLFPANDDAMFNGVEAVGAEGVDHWERMVKTPGAWHKVAQQIAPLRPLLRRWGVISPSLSLLSPGDVEILGKVVQTKKSDAFNVGSLVFRKYVLSAFNPIRTGGGGGSGDPYGGMSDAIYNIPMFPAAKNNNGSNPHKGDGRTSPHFNAAASP